MAIPKNCPLCLASHDLQKVVTPHVQGGKPGQAFFRCGHCDVSYLYPQLSAEEERHYYAQEFASFMHLRAGASAGWAEPEKHVSANASMRARRMKYLRNHLPAKGRVLEVGCSSGFMLYPLVDAGLECIGVEPSGAFSGYVRSRDIPCHDSIEELEASGQTAGGFDLIFHGFVLEHISAPRAFIRKQLDLLKPGGKLVFEIPNSNDALLTIYDLPSFERFYWIVAHAWYFSKPALEYFLTDLGLPYEILLDQRYDLSNHIKWARDGRPGGMGLFTEKFGQNIEDHYREALIASGHCDTLIGIITKP